MNETSPMYLGSDRVGLRSTAEKILLALVFMGAVLLIYTVFGPYNRLLEKSLDYPGRMLLIASLTGVYFLVRRSRRFEKYSQLVKGLLIMSVAVSLSWISGIYLLEYVRVRDTTPVGFALMKLNEAVVIVVTIISLTALFGEGVGSIYLQRGNLRRGLLIGILVFCLAAAGSAPMAGLLFKGNGLTLARVLPWIPWILIAALANGFEEELIFRGLFLRKLGPFLGKFSSNLIIALAFTFIHRGASYTTSDLIFLAALVPLALLWGYLMQKTDGIWASFLFHAGMDIPIFLGIFAAATS